MQYLSAYTLVSLSGQQPTFQSIQSVLLATGKPFQKQQITAVIDQLKGKDLSELINQGIPKVGGSVTFKPQKKKPRVYDEEYLSMLDQSGDRAEYHNLVDVLFVIDTTGSMSWCINRLVNTVCAIIENFADKQYNIKFALQLYRDHPPQEKSYVEKHYDLMTAGKIIQIIKNECRASGGGDTPEAVFDGLVRGLEKTSWRVSVDKKTKSKRFLFHGCDAPPHGQQYGSTSSDKNWTKNGCPCGLTRQDVNRLLDKNNVDYTLIKCGNQVQKMVDLFKGCFKDKFKREIQINQNDCRAYRAEYEEEEEDCDMGDLFDGGYSGGGRYAEKRCEIKCEMADEVVQEMQCGLFGFFD